MKPIVFLWDNFGPIHSDRVEAMAHYYAGERECIGVQEDSKSSVYEWVGDERLAFGKKTLDLRRFKGSFRKFRELARCAREIGNADWFLCNYDHTHILMFAWWLRFTRRRVFLMADSKFDDFDRDVRREFIKSILLNPFNGAIGCGKQSTSYLRYLLGPRKPIVGEYDTISLARIRGYVSEATINEATPFAERNFLIVARLVPKKNLFVALDAFRKYLDLTEIPRSLVICGSGPLEEELRAYAEKLGLTEHLTMTGFLQTEDISNVMVKSLALILPSIQEQFGQVIIEAQAVKLPVIVSEPCGARDLLVRNWQNGFVFEPDNPAGLAQIMTTISASEELYTKLSNAASNFAPFGDVARFVEGVDALLNSSKSRKKSAS